MASLGGELVVNERAPVTAWQKYDLDRTRTFKNLEAFREWYRPSVHGEVKGRVRSHFLFTDVLLDSIADVASVRKEMARDARGLPSKPDVKRLHQRVEVDGELYNSTWAAFQALGLGDVKECVRFRTALKRAGELEYKGRKFKII